MDEQKAREDLEFIKNIINDVQRKVIDNGKSLIIWGVFITLGLFSTYFGVKLGYSFSYGWNWLVLIGSGWVYTLYDVYKSKNLPKNRTFAGKILGMTWLGCGVAMTMFGFVGTYTGAYHGIYISPLLSTVLGIIYIVSGVIMDKSWISWLSICWWTGALIMFLFPYLYTILLMAGMIICFQIIPGIMIYREAKKIELG